VRLVTRLVVFAVVDAVAQLRHGDALVVAARELSFVTWRVVAANLIIIINISLEFNIDKKHTMIVCLIS
jgi:hypothetical protein